MKKYFLILVAMVCFGVTTLYADGGKTCKVAGGSVEVHAYAEDREKGIVSVSFSNDTNENVNVRYVISYTTYGGSYAKSGAKMVPANSDTTIDVNLGTSYRSVSISTVTGEKCNK